MEFTASPACSNASTLAIVQHYRTLSKRLILCCLISLNGPILHAACPVPSDATPRGPIKLNADGEFVPDWAKDAIWYQIFPERFRNGDPSNDPRVSDILGADPATPPKFWQIHPWGSDWYERQEYEIKNAEKDLKTHILRRRYGGDLQGIIDKLDYLQALGINAIYLNPVFDSPSLHKYDAASFHHIDPNFGPDPEGDRQLMANENAIDPETWVWTKADELALELIKQAHHRGIKIIFDGVFNHMGSNSFAFQDLKANQEKSPYKKWFMVNAFEDKARGIEFDYEGWFGVKSLPEFNEDENGLAPGPKNYVFAAVERWMDPKGKGKQHGIDGWRLDVAFCVAHGFWKDFRQHVKSINPDAYLTAEIVDSPDKVKPYMQGDEFDGEMNYNFAFTAAEFFFNPPPHNISASEFEGKLAEMRMLYPKGVAYVTQNLFGSHDSNRIGSHIVNRGIGNFRDWGQYFGKSIALNNPDYQVRKPNRKELQLQKLFIVLQMTYVGAPMIYYGDEVGMWGANDPDDRKPMLWSDIAYADEIYRPDGSRRAPDKVVVNQSLLEFYQQLIKIRNQYPALRRGDFKTLLVDDKKAMFAFQRSYRKETVIVVFNNSGKARELVLPGQNVEAYSELLQQAWFVSQENSARLKLPAKSAAILVKRE